MTDAARPEPILPDHRLPPVLRRWGGAALTLFLFLAGAYALYKVSASINLHDVLHQLRSIRWETLLMAGGATALGYTALIGYDWSALRYIGKSAPLSTMALSSFSAYALGNTIGLAVFSGGAVRYRYYRSLGLDPADVAVVSTFCALSFGGGVVLVGLAATLWHAEALATVLPYKASAIRLTAAMTLAVIVALGLWSSVSRFSFPLGRFRIGLPEPSILGGQVVFSVLDILFAGATLYLLLPATADIAFPAFIAVFALAAAAGVLSHVPGGVGVFEGVLLASLSPAVDPAALAASLIAYRIIYYLVPFFAAIVLLAVYEIAGIVKPRSTKAAAFAHKIGTYSRFVRPVVPSALAGLIFLAGVALLINGILPVPRPLIRQLEPLVPLQVLELSTIMIGALGMALILLANGIRRRVRAAFWLAIALLVASAASLAAQRTGAVQIFLPLAAALVLFSFRGEFYRTSKLSAGVFTPQWIALLIGILTSLSLLLLFAHKDVEYDHDLWWSFAFDANAPRALRAMGVATLLVFVTLIFDALRPAGSKVLAATPEALDKAAAIVRAGTDPDANFVFTGDKQILFSQNDDAFIMYRRHGSSFVALGDPVGPPEACEALLDDFIDLADESNCRPVFYQVSVAGMPQMIDLGFQLSKLGEEAVVDLSKFTIEGPSRSKLRQTYRRAGRDGLTLRIAAIPHEPGLLDRLEPISEAWLKDKNAREKSFSLGRFDRDYLARFPMVLVELEGEIVAFANLLTTDSKHEATIDLMRHTDGAPAATMDFLFTALMLGLKEDGYRFFSLGLAPLSGLQDSRRKRLWDHVGLAVFRLGGHFYNFEGLRKYKEKFQPDWRPRYFATWGGLDPLLAIADVNALVSGGLKGALSK